MRERECVVKAKWLWGSEGQEAMVQKLMYNIHGIMRSESLEHVPLRQNMMNCDGLIKLHSNFMDISVNRRQIH